MSASPTAEVIKHAFLPAVISYIALLYIVHLEALKPGMAACRSAGPAATWLQRLMGVLLGFVVTADHRRGAVYYGLGWLKAAVRRLASCWVVIALLLLVYVGAGLVTRARYPDLELDDPDKPVEALPRGRADGQGRAALPAAGGGAGLVPDGRAALARPVRLLRHRADDRHRGDAAAADRAVPRPGRARRGLAPRPARPARRPRAARAT